ncbi:MAG: helix-turn-helix domain-containing protein [Patescibacteria group bacterium]
MIENNQGNKLGKRIKTLRLKLELSQDEFVRKANIPYTTLTKIETGVIKKPSVFVMAKIVKALGVNIEELIK